MNEVTVPLLPCGSIDEIADFYEMLGFAVTYRQVRPNPYLAVRREDFELHFFGLPDFDPAESYGSCIVYVQDTGVIYRAFAARMRTAHGKLLVSGIPRMTVPRKRKNSDRLSGFSVIDPGGNWIRVFQASAGVDGTEGTPVGKLAQALESAIVLGDSKGDHRQAAPILDATLDRHGRSANVTDRVEALVYRAELAVRLNDGERADALLAQIRDIPLADADRQSLADALVNAYELEHVRRIDSTP